VKFMIRTSSRSNIVRNSGNFSNEEFLILAGIRLRKHHPGQPQIADGVQRSLCHCLRSFVRTAEILPFSDHLSRMPPITSCMSTPLLLSIQAAMNLLPAQVLPV
jgi:hypothetical protein